MRANRKRSLVEAQRANTITVAGTKRCAVIINDEREQVCIQLRGAPQIARISYGAIHALAAETREGKPIALVLAHNAVGDTVLRTSRAPWCERALHALRKLVRRGHA